MASQLEQIKELRSLTGAGINNIKEALDHGKGDFEKSLLYLREKGLAKAAKRADKTASNGFIAHYIHGEGNLGVLVELNSETDFASRNEKFRELAFNIALHVAAASPEYISVDDIPSDVLEKEKKLAKASIPGNKPEEILNKIVEGRLQKFYEESVLMEQTYVKDDSKKIKDLVNDAVASIGEKIEIGKFCRIKISAPTNSCRIK
jgi:elongation factor Ts